MDIGKKKYRKRNAAHWCHSSYNVDTGWSKLRISHGKPDPHIEDVNYNHIIIFINNLEFWKDYQGGTVG